MLAQTVFGIEKLYLVHRLDKVTSGLLIFARSSSAAATFSELFASRSIEKYYVALSHSKPKKKQGLIVGDMERSRDGQWKLMPSKSNPAITQFFSTSFSPGIRFFILKPRTGKTHQLRVALKSISSPITGDSLYKGTTSDRTYLHAFAIRFNYRGENIELSCPPKMGEYFVNSRCSELLIEHASPWLLAWPTLPNTQK